MDKLIFLGKIMQKKYLTFVLIILVTGCSSISMKKTINSVDRAYLEKKLGSYTILVLPASESYINYIKAVDRQSQLADDDKSSDRLQALQYRENQFFLFEIRHLNVVDVKKSGFRFSMIDAKGRSQIGRVIYFEKMYSDTVLGDEWIIIAKKPITSENFSVDELPLVLNIKFLNQEMQYEISPK